MIENSGILFLYHTSLRNMGLFITVTLASLVGWRYWKFGDNQLFPNIEKFFLIISMITSCVSLYIGYNTSIHINKEKHHTNNLNHKLNIIYLIMITASLLLGYSIVLFTYY
jgi:hypothetical protein